MSTDRQTLVTLLSLPEGKLTAGEKLAFRQWLDDLDNGVVSLSKKQKAWAQSVYVKHELDKRPRPPPKPLKGRVKSESLLDSMPRPLKPPVSSSRTG